MRNIARFLLPLCLLTTICALKPCALIASACILSPFFLCTNRKEEQFPIVPVAKIPSYYRDPLDSNKIYIIIF